MDKDTKITYLTISILIVILVGVAYILQSSDEVVPLSSDKKEVTSNTSVSKKTNEPIQGTTTEITKPTNTSSTTMQPTDKISHAVLTTNKGSIEIAFSDKTPNTVANFIKLSQEKFYDGVRFHRVIKDFMIQTGDPLSKDTTNMAAWGTGGPGYRFADELYGNEQYSYGTVAMANAGPNTNGSQFFIVTANPGYPLPPNYTVFGKVIKGMDVAEKIQNVTTGQSDRPTEDIIIEKVEVTN